MLRFSDLRYSVRAGRGRHVAQKSVLAGVSVRFGAHWGACSRTLIRLLAQGCAWPGRVLAIMGPSGSGKSTLLNILADRLQSSRGSILSGAVETAELGPLAFIPQDLAFFAHLTVEETLTLAAQLRKGRTAGEASSDVSSEVASLLHRLGLSEVAHSLVGGDAGGRNIPGISGGERRRLAIACETAGSAGSTASARQRRRIIFADEPTAGLDAFHADRVVDALCELAHGDGCCVVAVIHQPRSASFARLDDVLLLAPGGRVAYAGPASGALPHVDAAGFPCPERFNPATWCPSTPPPRLERRRRSAPATPCAPPGRSGVRRQRRRLSTGSRMKCKCKLQRSDARWARSVCLASSSSGRCASRCVTCG